MHHFNQFQPMEAIRGIRGILSDPNATEEAFRIVRAVDGGGLERLHRRFGQTRQGRRLLRERPRLLDALTDRAALQAMPEGSLGREYLSFCEREGITPGGLVEASDSEERATVPEELLYVADRMRDSHDLFHVVTGCRTDLAGELAVLTFTTAQTESVGIAVLTLAGFARSFTIPAQLGRQGRRLARAAWASGRDARWLPTADWESLLPLPLDEVRARLGVRPVPAYEPYYVEDLEAAA